MYKFSVVRLVNFRRNGVAELYCKNSEELESDGVIIVKTDFGDETIPEEFQRVDQIPWETISKPVGEGAKGIRYLYSSYAAHLDIDFQ